MKNIRIRLLILLAVLTIGTAPFSRTAFGDMRSIPADFNSGDSSVIGPFTGDPDVGQGSKSTTYPHSASQVTSADGRSSMVVVSRVMWVRAFIRIWAAMHWGVGQ